nr:MAG TPA: hypothetical protein [Caudoviricetes sp.]
MVLSNASYSCSSFLGNILPLNSRHASAGVRQCSVGPKQC